MTEPTRAPGGPGLGPTWSSSAKDMVSTALGQSRIWATFGFGIVNEVYWPSTGEPQTRDLGFIIAGPKGWIEVKRAQHYTLSTVKPHVPLTRVVHEGEGYRLELEFLPHPLRDSLLIRYKLDGDDLRLYALLAPHLGGDRTDNTAMGGEDLSAVRGEVALCCRADCGFTRASAGYVGSSDGWQDFFRNGKMTWSYQQADSGNVALMGELEATSGLIALAFARSAEGARTLARSSLADDYDDIRQTFIAEWDEWAASLELGSTVPELRREAELSAAVIKTHEDRTYAGALVASLSVPWGSSHDDLGGYHLVWTRDAVEAALALVVIGKHDEAQRILAYLIGTQSADGSWAQNYFPDGRGYWHGNQLDEVALPVLLAAKLRAVGALEISKPVEAMLHAAIGYIVQHGPMTDQDRWEENAGASPFTIAIAVCALVAVADFFSPAERDYVLSLADSWNERIEHWTYVQNGPFCERFNVEGYYVRIAPKASSGGLRGRIDVRNKLGEQLGADHLVGLEFLYLVRTGLRRADDPRIVGTLKVVDSVLRVDTPAGPAYRRYNDDGYGEHADGRPFDGTGIGRPWPLLTGERGHYAVAAGEDPRPYLDAMARMTGPGGLLPEQIWDSDPIPERFLFPGKPSGSAMPLVWAHAEFLKLLAARANGRPAEILDAVATRWNGYAPRAATWHWRIETPFVELPAGRALSIDAPGPFTATITLDDKAAQTRSSQDIAFGMHGVNLTADELSTVTHLSFDLSGDPSVEGTHQELSIIP